LSASADCQFYILWGGSGLDKKLYDLWKTEQYPFNQTIFIQDDLMKLENLHNVLFHVVKFLKNKFPNAKLFLNHDWHEHDGFINNSENIYWNDVDTRLKSAESLYDTRDGDYHVRITIYPSDLKFILRYHILDEDDDIELYPGIWGDFDLTIDKNYSEEIDDVFRNLKIGIISRTYPKLYFDKNYGG
jgi:hypothetical protein